MLGDLYYRTLLKSGVTSLARRLKHGALVLCYHNVVPDGRPSAGDPGLHLSAGRFTAQLDWLNDHYTVVSLQDVVARLEARRSVRGLAAITFDDGYAGAFTVAWPRLRKLGLPATMFVVAQAPARPRAFWWDHPTVVRTTLRGARERRLVALRGDPTRILADAGARPATVLPTTHLPADWRVVAKATADGLDVGAHTNTHRTLTTLDSAELVREIAGSRDIIRERTGVQPVFFSYPYGRWDGRVREAVHHAGYRAAVTLDYGLNTAGIDVCALRRMNVPASISAGSVRGVRPPPDLAGHGAHQRFHLARRQQGVRR
jgi:peptidoglycan/xylan/chitin deacetylase (PgdA/CDA1 family)